MIRLHMPGKWVRLARMHALTYAGSHGCQAVEECAVSVLQAVVGRARFCEVSSKTCEGLRL